MLVAFEVAETTTAYAAVLAWLATTAAALAMAILTVHDDSMTVTSELLATTFRHSERCLMKLKAAGSAAGSLLPRMLLHLRFLL